MTLPFSFLSTKAEEQGQVMDSLLDWQPVTLPVASTCNTAHKCLSLAVIMFFLSMHIILSITLLNECAELLCIDTHGMSLTLESH